MISRAALGQDTGPGPSAAEPTTSSEQPNSTALMVAGFVTLGIGGSAVQFATIAANWCLYCNRGAADAQKAQFYPFAIVGGIVGAIGIPLAIAGAYPVVDRRAPKANGALPAPTLLVSPRAAAVRWVF
jgi:hypothetical protein